jgi:RND family efflux transporter MFP subunit
MRKKIVTAVVVLGIVGVFGWAVARRLGQGGGQQGRRGGAATVAVESAAVRTATIRDVGTFTGSLEPKSQFVVSAKVSGRLKRLLVDVGDPVRRGQVIATLDEEEYVQQVRQAQAELQVAQAHVADCLSALSVAQREYERTLELREKNIASDSELDAAEAAYKACGAKKEVALAQVAHRKAALKAAGIRLSYATVRASWESGDATRVVGERYVDEGALLAVNDPIVSVLEENPLTAVIYVIERDYPMVKVAQPVTLRTDAYPGRTFSGEIARIAPLLRESSRQGRVEVEVPNPGMLLKAGMFIRAEIEFSVHQKATVVPTGALVKRNGAEGVFVVDEAARKARFVPVTVGITQGGLAEVTAPPLSGRVVTMGQHLLEDGARIVLPDDEPVQPPGAATTQQAERPAPDRPGAVR